MEHWKLQRISAILMIPIVILSLTYIMNITSIPHEQLINDLSSIFGFLIFSESIPSGAMISAPIILGGIFIVLKYQDTN